MSTNESSLKNTSFEYGIVFANSFSSSIDEVNEIKTAVSISAIRRIQFCVSPSMSVDINFVEKTGSHKHAMTLVGCGEFVFDNMSNCGPLNIDSTIYDGMLSVTTHGASANSGYTIVVSGTR